MLHHPDKHAAAGMEERRDHERKFQDIGEAYSVLSERDKREEYDRAAEGEQGWETDMEGNIDSDAIWEQFFGGGANTATTTIFI